MTNLEALRAKVRYPLDDNSLILALKDRGLIPSVTYSDKKSLELAYADLMYTLIAAPDVSEGGFSLSQNDKKILVSLANAIYTRYNEAKLMNTTVRFVNPW